MKKLLFYILLSIINIGTYSQTLTGTKLEITSTNSHLARFYYLDNAASRPRLDIWGTPNLINLRTTHGNSSANLSFGTHDAPNALFINNSGNVGIGGIGIPESKLQILRGYVTSGSGDATSGTLQFAGDYSGNNILNTYGSQYSTGATSIGYAVKQKSGSSGFISSAGNAAFAKGMLIIDNELEFLNAPGSLVPLDGNVNMTSRFKIDNNGNVGIGTTNTSNFKLSVSAANNTFIRSTTPSTSTFAGFQADANSDGFVQMIQFSTNRQTSTFGLPSDANWAFLYTGGASSNGLAVGTYTNKPLIFGTNNKEAARIMPNGNVGIGTTNTQGFKLAVKGKIGAEEIQVHAPGYWPDYVFSSEYNLKPLSEVESFIEQNNHLPDIPSEKEVKEKGINIGDMNAKLLQKIEELTLYMINMNKEMEVLKVKNDKLQKQINEMIR